MTALYDPALADVRRFFCGVWRKHRDGLPLEPLEAVALDWIRMHPEYHPDLDDVAAALVAEYPAEAGRTNPFLHLSLHLAIAEQRAIDQPAGIRDCLAALERRLGDAHEAAHAAQECLAETLWHAQRNRRPVDEAIYLDCLRRRASPIAH